jgi:hypothetical protein
VNPIGFSSGCCPELSGTEIVELAGRLRVDLVDLRAGKGHGWEALGVAPLRAVGIRVAFVGVSLVLGRPDQRPAERLSELDALGAGGLPVKVFADAALDADPAARQLARRQLAELDGVPVLVETHHGYASVPALARLCGDTGCRLLLDTLALARLHGDLAGAAAALRPYLVAGQVKGYDVADAAGGVHLPLRAMTAGPAAQVRDLLPPGAPVLVESRAGVLADDLAVLRDWLAPRDAEETVDA